MILIFKQAWLWIVTEIFPPILLVMCSWTSWIAYCFVFLISNPYYIPTAPPSFLLYSFYFYPSCDLHFPTCTFWKKKVHTLLIHKKWTLPPISIPWTITSKIISQMKGRKSELLLPPDSTRSLQWMQKCAEWKKHSSRCPRASEAQAQIWQIWSRMIHTFVDWGKWISASNIHLGNWIPIIVL